MSQYTVKRDLAQCVWASAKRVYTILSVKRTACMTADPSVLVINALSATSGTCA